MCGWAMKNKKSEICITLILAEILIILACRFMCDYVQFTRINLNKMTLYIHSSQTVAILYARQSFCIKSAHVQMQMQMQMQENSLKIST